MRRLRESKIRPLLAEHSVRKEDLVMPLFVDQTASAPVPIGSMPGQFRYPLLDIPAVVRKLSEEGVRAVLLFGIPDQKDEMASQAYHPRGIVQEAVRAIAAAMPGMVIITDVCACEYTSHGHCGIVAPGRGGPDVQNDASLDLMARIAVSHAEAGADIVAPSCMMDGVVSAIRHALDENGYSEVLIMSYSTKFSSALYGPFREAADSGFLFGDRSTYQLPPSNGREALMESRLDADEGADILMVKPAGLYLDLVAKIREFGLPVAAYQVSGEYSQIKAAAERGWIKEREVVMESMLCMKRAGADLLITYFAEDIAGWLDEEQ
ncbi:porphobilinogen synthase [Methanolinea mesophila]|uniref:porphobilinogen synthase n=1 Tax=Methanolinea mesophila TaxID=547055 RepID=UPI001FD7282A|nr:porphobilinogen synthase [Methanolinea mesophila]